MHQGTQHGSSSALKLSLLLLFLAEVMPEVMLEGAEVEHKCLPPSSAEVEHRCLGQLHARSLLQDRVMRNVQSVTEEAVQTDLAAPASLEVPGNTRMGMKSAEPRFPIALSIALSLPALRTWLNKTAVLLLHAKDALLDETVQLRQRAPEARSQSWVFLAPCVCLIVVFLAMACRPVLEEDSEEAAAIPEVNYHRSKEMPKKEASPHRSEQPVHALPAVQPPYPPPPARPGTGWRIPSTARAANTSFLSLAGLSSPPSSRITTDSDPPPVTPPPKDIAQFPTSVTAPGEDLLHPGYMVPPSAECTLLVQRLPVRSTDEAQVKDTSGNVVMQASMTRALGPPVKPGSRKRGLSRDVGSKKAAKDGSGLGSPRDGGSSFVVRSASGDAIARCVDKEAKALHIYRGSDQVYGLLRQVPFNLIDYEVVREDGRKLLLHRHDEAYYLYGTKNKLLAKVDLHPPKEKCRMVKIDSSVDASLVVVVLLGMDLLEADSAGTGQRASSSVTAS